MNKLRQLKFAFQDFCENIKWVLLICIGLSVSMVSLSFVMNILLGYESSGMPALNEYNKNELVKITMVDTHSIANENEVVSFILSYIEENDDISMLSFPINLSKYGGQMFFIGLGNFSEFYGINNTSDVSFTAFGEAQYSKEFENQILQVDSPLQYISSHGRVLVIPMSEVFITGSYKEIMKMTDVSFRVSDLLNNFVFVNAEEEEILEFVSEINSLSPSVVVFSEDMNDLLNENVIGQSFEQLLVFGIFALVILVGTYLVMTKLIMYINDKSIKSFTLHYFSGAFLSDIYLRSFFLNLIIIAISSIGGIFVLYTINLLGIWEYILMQALIYCVIFPIVPIIRIRKLNLYDNLRGDYDDKKD